MNIFGPVTRVYTDFGSLVGSVAVSTNPKPMIRMPKSVFGWGFATVPDRADRRAEGQDWHGISLFRPINTAVSNRRTRIYTSEYDSLNLTCATIIRPDQFTFRFKIGRTSHGN